MQRWVITDNYGSAHNGYVRYCESDQDPIIIDWHKGQRGPPYPARKGLSGCVLRQE